MKIAVIFYSHYGHMFQLAQAAAEGAKEAGGEVRLLRIAETMPEEVLQKTGGFEPQKAFAHLPVATVDDLLWADGILFGVPTRYGNMSAQVAAFFDATGQIWAQGGLIGKIGGVMSASATQHGGQESTILHVHTTLLAHGMVVTGLPYSYQGLFESQEVSGGSVFGATTVTGSKGERMPSPNELGGAKFQGNHLAKLAGKLAR